MSANTHNTKIAFNRSINQNTQWQHQWSWKNPFKQQWCPLYLMKILLIKMAAQNERTFRLCLEREQLEFQEALTQVVSII